MNKLLERTRVKDITRLANVPVGIVDYALHGRSGVLEASRKWVGEVLKQLDYQPSMCTSALASNKKHTFACLLPKHLEGEYWTDMQKGIRETVSTYSDFGISVDITHYDPYDYNSFATTGQAVIKERPDGVMLAPTIPQYTKEFAGALNGLGTPYTCIDSQIKDIPLLAFLGQNSHQSGYFAAHMPMLLAGNDREVVIFRKIREGVIGSNQQENRETGLRQYMREHHPDCSILGLDLHADPDIEDSRMLDDFFSEHPKVKNGVAFNSKVYIIDEYLKMHRKNNINLISYDLPKRSVAYLKEGTAPFLIAQQPELQGFNSIRTLCDHLVFEKEVTCTNYTPIDLLTKESINYYNFSLFR